MSVPEQTPFIEYTANGTTTVFPVPFQCDKAEYLIVNLDGNEAPVGSWSFVNGSVTFNTAPANGVVVNIERNTPFQRTTDYQSYNNSFRPAPVNKDFDLIWWKLQELGVADWILHNRIDALKAYVDRQDSELQQNIDNLKIYVDDKDDELRAYLLEEIRKQGVALDQLDEYYNYLMRRLAQIAIDKGWEASFVVDASGKTQQEINDSIAVKFLVASEIGLTKWEDFTKPPYTTQQYEQAYNNGVNLAIAVKEAYAAGYSKVILERGKYPFCYANTTKYTAENFITTNCLISEIENFDIDLNGSSLFVIFDSVNRSPYDLGTTLAPYQLPGAVMGLEHTTNVTLKKGFFRGDQYFRSWVVGENTTQQTYGVHVKKDNINFNVDECIFTGFRGDGISGEPKGSTIYGLGTWYQGGVDAGGVDIVETGSYRTGKLDLQGKTVLRNAVQINTTGYLRGAEFRNDVLSVFFYDQSGAFQSSEKCRQTEFIYLPKNCRYVQFVAYDDKRTDATVGYGNWVVLASGNSDGALIDRCKFYENHRGGISNLCANTTINACDFYDNGGTKQGFKPYSDPTRYAINFEDSYVTKLTVINCRIRNHTSAILCNARNLHVENSLIQDIQFYGVGAFATVNVNVLGNTFDNVGKLFDVATSELFKKRFYKFSNNIIKRSQYYNDIALLPNAYLAVQDNVFSESRITLTGDGRNLIFENNASYEVLGQYVDVFKIKGALSASNNKVFRDRVKSDSTSWAYLGCSAVNSNNNYLYLTTTDNRVQAATVVNEKISLVGLNTESVGKTLNIGINDKRTGFETHVDNITVDACKFKNTILYIGADIQYQALCNLNATIKNTVFENGAYLRISRRDTATPSSANIVISDTVFDLTNASIVVTNTHPLLGTVDITFINCTFKSDTVKSLAFIQGQTANITAKAIGCEFVNVKDSGSILQIDRTAKVTYDPPSLAAGAVQSTTVTLAGAVVGDAVVCSFSLALNGTRMWAEVTAANTVTVYHQNPTNAAVDIGSGTLIVKLI
ncbi:phage tail fiber protein [Acinetobacter baumannii]